MAIVQEEQVKTIESVKAVALRKIGVIKELKDKKKMFSEQKKSILDNDKNLQKAIDNAEELVKAIKTAKDLVTAKKNFSDIVQKNKDTHSEIKELIETLTGHLLNYSKMAEADFIEDESGKVLKIQHKISLKDGQLKLF